jgi:predicted HD phosphohydrolase
MDLFRLISFKNSAYYKQLSDASKRTLNFQGGPMDEKEAKDFEKDEWFPLYITLREWDEKAKVEHIPLPDLGRYKLMMIQNLTQNKNKNNGH